MTARTPRPAARILLIDPRRRVMLFRFTASDRPPFWCTPGGALDPGESYSEAAVRELREETGFELPCGPEVAQRHIEFLTLEGVEAEADERYFLVRVPHTRIETHGHTALEQAVMRTWDWFDRDTLAASTERFYPEDLPEMLVALGIW